MTLPLSLAALLVSAGALLLLGIADPKRRRVGGLRTVAPGRPRHVGIALALLPGAALIVIGAWAALLIWIGGCTVIGWAITTALAPRRAAA